VLAKLLAKEYEAHRTLGDAGSLMGLHSATDEERAIEEALAARRSIDEIIPDRPSSEFDLMLAITGGGGEPVATVDPPTLFDSDLAFAEEPCTRPTPIPTPTWTSAASPPTSSSPSYHQPIWLPP